MHVPDLQRNRKLFSSSCLSTLEHTPTCPLPLNLLAPPDHSDSKICALSLNCNVLFVYGDGTSSPKIVKLSDASELVGMVIDRTEDVLTFTLDNTERGNEVTCVTTMYSRLNCHEMNHAKLHATPVIDIDARAQPTSAP